MASASRRIRSSACSRCSRGSSAPLEGANGGAGIGLALAKRLARMHGGDLTAWSAGENRGTTFTRRHPAARRSSPITLDSAPERLRSIVAGAALDILLIEDNDDVADTLGALARDARPPGHDRAHRSEGARARADDPAAARAVRYRPARDGRRRGLPARPPGRRDFRPVMVALTGWGKKRIGCGRRTPASIITSSSPSRSTRCRS